MRTHTCGGYGSIACPGCNDELARELAKTSRCAEGKHNLVPIAPDGNVDLLIANLRGAKRAEWCSKCGMLAVDGIAQFPSAG